MLKWVYFNVPENCDDGPRPTVQHILVCELIESGCSAFIITISPSNVPNSADSWKDTNE